MTTLLALLAVQADAEEARHTVRRGAITPLYTLDALLQPARELKLRLRLDRYQGDLRLEAAAAHGREVKAGDVLLAIDPAPLRKQIASAEHDVRLSKAQLAKAEADAELGAKADALDRARAERAVADAETELKSFDEVTGKHMLQQVELSVRMNEDMLQDQTEELDQLLKMYKSEDLTSATAEIVVRRARRTVERVKVHLEMAREEARVTKDIRHPQERRKRVDDLESDRQRLASLKAAQALSAVQREVEPAKARAALAEHEETLAQLKSDLEALTVRAPFEGRVFHGELEQGHWTSPRVTPQLVPGEKLQPGQVYLTLCGPGVVVRADVPEADYFDIDAGMSAAVRPVAAPAKTSTGRVASKSILAVAESGPPAFHARIELDPPRTDLFPGMKAKVVIRGRERRDVLLLPSEAVQFAGDKATVQLVAKDGKVAPREVVVGESDGALLEVREGLSEGDAVVLPK